MLWECPVGCHAILSFAWSPDGTRIVVSTTTPNHSGPSTWYDGLHVIDLASGADTQVVKAGTLPGRPTHRPVAYSGLAWSPNSRWIAYTGSGKYIGVVNATGTRHHAINTGIREVSTPTWLGRGDRIGFSGWTPGQGTGEWTIRRDGSHVQTISHRNRVAVWSPARDMVAYTAPCGYRLFSASGKHLTTVKRCPALAAPTTATAQTQPGPTAGGTPNLVARWNEADVIGTNSGR